MAVADPIVGVGKILIVEDDRHELRALSEFLERKGYSVIEAQNGGKRWTISATVLPFLSSCSTLDAGDGRLGIPKKAKQ